MKAPPRIDYSKLFISIALPLFAGFAGSFFTVPSLSEWYPALIKPAFNPPAFVFGPVWTILYLMMGISVYLIWNNRAEDGAKKRALTLFWFQFAANAVWTPVFFGLRNPALALADILVLWLLIVATIVLFHRIRRSAAYLLIPYLGWVSFAAFLNYSIVILNQ